MLMYLFDIGSSRGRINQPLNFLFGGEGSGSGGGGGGPPFYLVRQ